MTPKELTEIVDKAVVDLAEHFDTVQILVSVNQDKNTECIKRGSGNWYARVGMARELLIEDSALIKENALENYEDCD